MQNFWRAALAVGGIATVGAFVFWSLYKKWLSLPIFSQLSQAQTYNLMLVFLTLVFLVAICCIIGFLIQKRRFKEAPPASAFYAEDQAKSARRQADAAELANSREELTSLNMAEPDFQWMPPTGSKDGIEISFKNVGGLVELTHAEVKSANVDTPLLIPRGKISSGETIRLHFKPPVEDQIYPMILVLQFRDCSQEICESTVRCERLGEKFRTLA